MLFTDPRKGYMYTPSQGFKKAIALEYNLSKKHDINAELIMTVKQLGLGVNKHFGKKWSLGLGVASEYTKFKPEMYASVTRSWSF